MKLAGAKVGNGPKKTPLLQGLPGRGLAVPMSVTWLLAHELIVSNSYWHKS
jgi:hypothetical protein